MIEPITGTNLAALGDGELSSLIKFHTLRSKAEIDPEEVKTSQGILLVLMRQKEWRDRVSAVGCSWLKQDGSCRHGRVTGKHGEPHACPKLNNSGCTLMRMEAASKFSKAKRS